MMLLGFGNDEKVPKKLEKLTDENNAMFKLEKKI